MPTSQSFPGAAAQGPGGPQALLDPARLAHLRASLPPSMLPGLERFVDASRLGLASTLHDLFLLAAAVAAVALIATVPVRGSARASRREARRGARGGEGCLTGGGGEPASTPDYKSAGGTGFPPPLWSRPVQEGSVRLRLEPLLIAAEEEEQE